MKLVECPICYLSVDIENLSEGTKVKCEKCQKVIGLIEGDKMLPAVLSRSAKKKESSVQQEPSSKLVECPICNSKFDTTNIPEGTKLKCNQCKEIFGIIQGGQMVSVGVITAPEPMPELEPEPELIPELEPEPMPELEPEPELIPEIEPKPMPEFKPELISDVEAEAIPETGAMTELEDVVDVEEVSEVEAIVDVEAVPESESATELEPKPMVNPEPSEVVEESHEGVPKENITQRMIDSKIRRPSCISEATKFKSKLEPLLYVAALIAVISIAVFVYILLGGVLPK
jgi:hypothetical protein